MIDMIDHFVLTVRDIGAACDFYARTLGMQVVTFGNGRKALQFGEFGEHKICTKPGKNSSPRPRNPRPDREMCASSPARRSSAWSATSAPATSRFSMGQ